MPRYNQSAEGFINGGCKIRKRGCSSSSSSSLLRSNRFKKAIPIRKRGGSTTPVPMWKMNGRSPSYTGGFSVLSLCQRSNNGASGAPAPVSARKLANALWELSRNPSSLNYDKFNGRSARTRNKGASNLLKSIEAVSLPLRLSDPSHSPASLMSLESRSSSHRRMISMISQKLQNRGHNYRTSHFGISGNLLTDCHRESFTHRSSIMLTKKRLKDLRNGLTSSKDLVKILSQLWELDDPHPAGFTIFSALFKELENAFSNVNQLIQEHRCVRSEINNLKEHFAVEIQTWNNNEQERISSAVHSITKELESEKKLRKRAERLNKKLAMELIETRTSLLAAADTLTSERRSREIIEHVCDELEKGFGEEKVEVEELKRESAKALEELEKERKMLELASDWREERVEMKLSEANLQFEEKNAAVNRLRNELEAFLTAERGNRDGKGDKDADGVLEVDDHNQSTDYENVENHEKDNNGELSEDCDLHSIELNMDSKNRSFSWSYATDSANNEEKYKGRSESSDKASRSNREAKEGNFSHDMHSMLSTNNGSLDEDAERYISVKELRDHLLAGSSIVVPHAMRSPNWQWGRLQRFHNSDRQINKGSKVAELIKQLEKCRSKV